MKTYSKLLSAVVFLFCLGIVSAQSAYLKIGDIKGESTASGHEDWIVIESVSFGLDQQLATTGTTRRRASVKLEDLVIMKTVDKATPKLMEACAKGQAIPELELDMVAASGQVYYKLTLNNVRVIGVKTNAVYEPEYQLIEEVSISYSKIKWEYTDSSGRKVESSYDAQRGN
ncbi:MAG: type VI secretion system tube protein Hcp [Bacteroidia bacterium]|nr:type VI secretion system tube protein Hcp [Bacteroidia bacterium]NNL79841.1 type VI secretion system tube protein Hcp [Flavobacteriaceae bacterium]